MGGALRSPPRSCILAPPSLLGPWATNFSWAAASLGWWVCNRQFPGGQCLWVGPEAQGPPRCSGTVRGSRRAFLPTFRTFLGVYSSHSRVSFTRLLVYTCVFFPEIALRRNQIIKEVVLVEEKSILVFPALSEASGVKFSWGEGKCRVSNRNLSRQKKGGRKPP